MPERVVVNSESGAAVVVPLTPTEQADYDARQVAAASAAAEQAVAEQTRNTERTDLDALIAKLTAGTALTTTERRRLDLYAARSLRRELG